MFHDRLRIGVFFFFFQAEDGIRDLTVTGVQTCALPILALAPGSYLVISHASYEGMPEKSREHEQLYARMPTPLRMRSRAAIAHFFDGFEIGRASCRERV